MKPFKMYSNLSEISKAFVAMEAIASLSWSVLLPLITKLQGIYWATSVIASYFIAHQVVQLLLPYLGQIKLNTLYKVIIALDVLYLTSLSLYYININIFLLAEAMLMVIYEMAITAIEIKFNSYLMYRYNHKEYENTATIERVVSAAAAIIGYLTIIGMDALWGSAENYINVFAVLLTVNLIFRFNYYRKYWHN